MFDASLRPWLNPVLDRLGRALAAAGVTADALTITGCGLGLGAAVAVGAGAFKIALSLFLLGRVLDGLDGAVARATTKTDAGGYLDIVLDFAVYAAVPLAFGFYQPAEHALPAACLLAAIVLNGSAFLAFAALAERRGWATAAQGEKSLYYLAGLAEGTETIAVYSAFCLWPSWFGPLAYGFAGLCVISGIARIVMAWRMLQ
jgi:phosphatidylglycerophosphate synthase